MACFTEAQMVAPSAEGDFASLTALATALAAHHGDRFAPAPDALARDYGHWYEARLARTVDGHDVGFVSWHRFYASECAERGLEVRNLFVEERYRGCGIGRALLAVAAGAALAADCKRMRLGVRKDNVIGVDFYKHLGCLMSDMGETWGCRWTHEGIMALAGCGLPSQSR